MARLDSLFRIHNANSTAFKNHAPGEVAYVSNGEHSNGVVGFVKPVDGDSVFHFTGITASAMRGFAVQTPPFIVRGSAGSGLMVLELLLPSSKEELFYFAAYLNKTARWRFSWCRQLTKDRLKALEVIPPSDGLARKHGVESLLPENGSQSRSDATVTLASFELSRLFKFTRARSGLLSEFEVGDVPYVGNGDLENNGVAGYVKISEDDQVFKRAAIVVSALCEATVQPASFVACGHAGNGLLVLEPMDPMTLETMLCVAAEINRSHKWRFNWYRQTTLDRVKGLKVSLPVSDGNVSDEGTRVMAEALPYFRFVQRAMSAGNGTAR